LGEEILPFLFMFKQKFKQNSNKTINKTIANKIFSFLLQFKTNQALFQKSSTLCKFIQAFVLQELSIYLYSELVI
jgi:hypothetical protein